jgi:putative tricarboxylic transport membrane protein
LVILNLPLIGMWVQLLKIPYRLLYPMILVFCCIGVYTVNNTTFDVWIIAAFGVIGYIFAKLECEAAPLLLGFILGPMMEENLRRALLLSRGSPSVFWERPISAVMLTLSIILLIILALPAIRQKRDETFVED